MRTTLDLPDPTFRRLKAEASIRGLKLKEMVCLFIEAGLASNAPRNRMEARRRSPLPVTRKATGTPHSALSNAHINEILTLEEYDGEH
jgi:hypothetical protein